MKIISLLSKLKKLELFGIQFDLVNLGVWENDEQFAQETPNIKFVDY